jgi:hypothetical protein
MIIQDGTGKGRMAKVNVDNQLHTYAVTNPRFADAAARYSLAFSWSNVTYDFTAGDTILLVKNEDPDRLLRVGPVWISGDVATEFIIHCPVVVTPTGTAVVGVNLDRRSNNVAKATAIGDETTNSQANVIHRGRGIANFAFNIDFQGALVLGEDDCVAVDLVAEGAAANVTILGYYQDNDLDY